MGNLLRWSTPLPQRLSSKPPSLPSEPGAEDIFNEDTKHWTALVSDVYLDGMAINLTRIRNVMDMNAGYGGFAAMLVQQPLWMMNVVQIDSQDTLSVIFERGLIGVYHDWCESFNTYPRTYDLLHSSFLFKNLKYSCDIIDVAVEIDRILDPVGIFWSKIQRKRLRSSIQYTVHSTGRQLYIKVNFLLGRKVFGVRVNN